MIDYVIIEPEFSASPARCFKLPFVVTEALCSGSSHILRVIFEDDSQQILSKLFSFLEGAKNLNYTLGGYFNKIVSFFLLKETDRMIAFVIQEKNIVQLLYNHLYLT